MFEVSESDSLGDNKIPKVSFPITINHLNVLCGAPLQKTILGQITQEDSRIDLVVNDISKSDCFFYGLNEVVEKLRQKILKELNGEGCWVSDAGNVPMKSHNCFIVAKHPFILAKRHRRQLAIFEIDGKPLIIGSLHMTAYEGKKYQDLRKSELSQIRHFLQQPEGCISVMSPLHKKTCGLIRDAVSKGNVFLTGDMNLHCLGETDIIYDNGFQDLWLNLNQLQEGFTWDAKSNPLIQMVLPLDNRRMRLDRMISLPPSPESNFSATSLTITHKDRLEAIRAPVLRTPLCLSDHYGLSMTLAHRTRGHRQPSFNYWQNRQMIISNRDPTSTGYRPMSRIIAYRVMVVMAAVIIVMALIKYVAC